MPRSRLKLGAFVLLAFTFWSGANRGDAEGPPKVLSIIWHGKHGLIDAKGNLLLKPIYDGLGNYNSTGRGVPQSEPADESMPWMAVQVGQRFGFVNRRGEMVIEPKWSRAGSFYLGRAQVCLDDKWGLIDQQGKFIVEPAFSYIGDFIDGRARVAVGGHSLEGGHPGGKWGFIDESGKLIVPAKYDYVRDFDRGRALVNTGGVWRGESGISFRDGHWGVVDKQGAVVLEPQIEVDPAIELQNRFPQLDPLAPKTGNDLRRVKIGGRFGFVDGMWSIKIKPTYAMAEDFSEGIAAVMFGQNWGYIDREGMTVIQPRYDAAGPFREGLAAVRMGEDVSYIDPRGVRAFSIKATSGSPFSNGIACVNVGDLWGIVDKTGRMILRPEFSQINAREDGFYLATRDGKQGLVNESGQLIVETKYDFIGAFQESGLAWAGIGEMSEQPLRTLIDRTGKVVVSTESFRYQPRKQGGKWGIWDSESDRFEIEPRFERLQELDVGIIEVVEKSLSGMFDLSTGEMLLDVKYGSMRPFHEGLAHIAVAYQKHSIGFVDRRGNFVIPPSFDFASNFENGLAGIHFYRRTDMDSLWVDKTGRYLWHPKPDDSDAEKDASDSR